MLPFCLKVLTLMPVLSVGALMKNERDELGPGSIQSFDGWRRGVSISARAYGLAAVPGGVLSAAWAGKSAGYLLCLALLLFVAGCSPKPADLCRKAVRAEAEAKRAFEQHDVEAADLAAARAQDAFDELKTLAESTKPVATTAKKFLKEARDAAGSARNYAELAREEEQCRKRLATLKLKAYRQLREGLCGYALSGLAPAAEQFARAGTNSLSAIEQPLASLAWNLVELVDDRPLRTNGAPDWQAVAADLRSATTNPPPRLGLFLTLAFALGGMGDFALSEIESVDASKLSATNSLALYHLERGALYAVNGWDRTASRELDLATQLSPKDWNGLASTQALALIHFWLADHSLQRNDLRQADRQLARALEEWPDCALAPFIIADQLNANGDWAKAADLLEAKAGAVPEGWLSKRLAERARALREGKGSIPPLFADKNVVLETVWHSLGDSAQDSVAMKKLEQILTVAKAFSERVLGKLPGLGAE
jgi:hypothetical protein